MSGDLLERLSVEWLAACDLLQPFVQSLQFVAERLARRVARLEEDKAEQRRMCDDVMEHLGFRKARLGRVPFYVRQTKWETGRHEHPGSGNDKSVERARERAAGRFAASDEQLERLARARARR